MKRISNYNEVQAAGEYGKLAPGGYVIRITKVEDNPQKEYLSVVFDIAEGPEAGRYKDEAPDNDYRHRFIRSYKEKALPMFKAFTVAVDECNNTKFTEQIAASTFDERQLVGKILGVTLGYEEYATNAGEIKERLALAYCMSADRIRRGDFKVPELKKYKGEEERKGSPVEGFTPLGDADIPF